MTGRFARSAALAGDATSAHCCRSIGSGTKLFHQQSSQAPWVVPDYSVLLEKIIQNQTMPQLLDLGQVDNHLCRALAAIAFVTSAETPVLTVRPCEKCMRFMREGRPKLLVDVHLIAGNHLIGFVGHRDYRLKFLEDCVRQ